MLRAIAHTAVTNFSIQLLTLASSLLVARTLGPSGRGELATILLWPMLFAQTCLFGTDVGIARYASAARNAPTFLIALSLGAFLGVSTMLAAYFALPLILPTGKLHLLEPSRYASLVVPISITNVLLFSSELGSQRFGNYNLARFTFSILYLVAILGLYLGGQMTVWGTLVVFVAASLVSTCVTAYLSFKSNDNAVSTVGTILTQSFNVVASSRQFALSSIVLTCVERFQFLLLLFLCDLNAMGVYTIAFSLSAAHMSFGAAVSKVLFAKLARLREADELNPTWLCQIIRQLTATYVALALAMLCALHVLVPLVLGAQYQSSRSLLYLLIPATTLLALVNIFDDTLKGHWGSATPGVISRLSGVSLMALVATLLVKDHGVIGIGIAVAAKTATEYASLLIFLSRKLRTPIAELLLPKPADIGHLRSRILKRMRTAT